jgi:aldose 1-epimerase
VAEVAGTPFDFTKPKAVGRDLGEIAARAVPGGPMGYDHNFVVDGQPGTLRPVARLVDPASGRALTLSSDAPGVQVYSGNFLDGSIRGKGGAVYARHAGLCLETQAFPNAINVPAWKQQALLTPDRAYRHVMLHRFTAE